MSGGFTVAIEKSDPEKFADFLVQLSEDPECNIAALGRRCGLSRQAAHLIAKRIQTRYMPMQSEVEKVSSKTLLRQMDEALPLLLKRLKDTNLINKSTLRDVAITFGVMIDKRQLLSGEPTQILSLEERRNLNDLAPAIVEEIKKRGQSPVEVEYEDYPPEGPGDPALLAKSALNKTKAAGRARGG